MSRPTIYESIENLRGSIKFNITKISGDTTNYVPLVINLHCVVRTSDGGRKDLQVDKEIGTPSNKPLTNEELYKVVPAELQSMIKDLVIQAIDEDPSIENKE